MQRIAIMADIHGNLPALEAVLADIEQEHITEILVAGDLIGGCPQPGEVIDCLRAVDARMILGNNDLRLLRMVSGDLPSEWMTCKQYAPARAGNPDQTVIEFLASLPEQLIIQYPGTETIRVVHGTPDRIDELLYPSHNPAALNAALAQITESVMVCGHTHIPWIEQRGNQMAINPGAVCAPYNGEIGAQYAILEWDGNQWQAEHRLIPYDLAQLRASFEHSGLLDQGGVARAMLLTIETGRDYTLSFLRHAYQLAEESGFPDLHLLPDTILDEAERTFSW
jgi:putative phosphoesterase